MVENASMENTRLNFQNGQWPTVFSWISKHFRCRNCQHICIK